MKLFHFAPDCEGSSEAFAVAETKEEAKVKLLAKRATKDIRWHQQWINDTIDSMVNEKDGYKIHEYPVEEAVYL